MACEFVDTSGGMNMNEEEFIQKRVKELRAFLNYEEALLALAREEYHKSYLE